jgi:CRISPR-associated endonuclease Cas1
MQAKSTERIRQFPDEIVPKNGILVLSGYGVDIRVWRGRLCVDRGFGRSREQALVHRATGRLRRLVVLGHTGCITLEAIRWLIDVGASYLQLDADGRVLAAFGPTGADRPELRRAQATAMDSGKAVKVAKQLVRLKVERQVSGLDALEMLVAVGPKVREVIRGILARIDEAEMIDQVRAVEAQAAAAYWGCWSPLPIHFIARERDLFPEHWLDFGSRASVLTSTPRAAANPINALLNYLYALLEGEATVAARTLGLDPGVGLMHSDHAYRDSLAADLMEPVRPLVDRYVIELLSGRQFSARDFVETRAGACRLTASLARSLAQSVPNWRRALAPIAERVATELVAGARTRPVTIATPLTQDNRSAGREGIRVGARKPIHASPARLAKACRGCGVTLSRRDRSYCPNCLPQISIERLAKAHAVIAQLREAGRDPNHGGLAGLKRGAANRRHYRLQEIWERSNPNPDRAAFSRDLLPKLEEIRISQLVRATGLSRSYWWRVRRGQSVPHPRHWANVRELLTREN